MMKAPGFCCLGCVVLHTDKSATGGAVCGSFVVFGALAVIVYRPWRRKVDGQRALRSEQLDVEGVELGTLESECEIGPRLHHARPEILIDPGLPAALSGPEKTKEKMDSVGGLETIVNGTDRI